MEIYTIKVKKGKFGWSVSRKTHLSEESWSIVNSEGLELSPYSPESFERFLRREARGVGKISAQKIMNEARELGEAKVLLSLGKKNPHPYNWA